MAPLTISPATGVCPHAPEGGPGVFETPKMNKVENPGFEARGLSVQKNSTPTPGAHPPPKQALQASWA
jgi:hypothetical protein